MSRLALATFVVLLAIALKPAASVTPDPHLDPTLLPRGCLACHAGHGRSQSPMLPRPQRDLCLSCHGSRARLDEQVTLGTVSARARPALLDSAFAKPYTHAIDTHAFSRLEPGLVTCTSCHSPHRGALTVRPQRSSQRRKLSPRNPNRFEYELCGECHGNRGAAGQSLGDISRLLDPVNPSYHPVEAPARRVSETVSPPWRGAEINCTDCHGNSDVSGPRGPHGSAEPFLLKAAYRTTSGGDVSSYALCFTCHDRSTSVDLAGFPEHRLHIQEVRASCASCHDPHGSIRHRALIRFGEETVVSAVAPSPSTGRLEFLSDGPGTGTCYLTCHGRDHAPESYGFSIGS